LSFKRIWGEATTLVDRSRKIGYVDVLVVVGLAGLFFAVLNMAQGAVRRPLESPEIDTSIWVLPWYTFQSLMRGLVAYVLSLGFTLVYGYWAAKDHVAERVLVPMLDILQSIPVLSFMPLLLLALAGLFAPSSLGLELVAIIMIFTGQAWNMTFSFYHSLRSVPQDQQEVATTYRFTWWQRLRWVELPFSTMGLVWNSMMSMAGGWFFLISCEAMDLGEEHPRLPGIGSYMKEVSEKNMLLEQILASAAMITMIVMLDQLLWRPVVVWAQKFRVEEGGSQEAMTSWFLDWLKRSRIVAAVWSWLERLRREPAKKVFPSEIVLHDPTRPSPWVARFSFVVFVALLCGLVYGAWQLLQLLAQVRLDQWQDLASAGGFTFGRVFLSLVFSTLWAVPAGLAIGLSSRLSRTLQPVVQVLAAYPAPLYFPFLIVFFDALGVSLGWYSIVLMMVGTQWYILFNIIAGTMAIPADLKEAAVSYRIAGWQRFWRLYFPALFPYLVTGWVTAAGGAWNASIVCEYLTYGKVVQVPWGTGLGAIIADSAANKNFALLAAATILMSAIVVVFNRTVWKRCYRLAESKYSLSK
jgi:NitT/TauT family transport system permease protein